jgi:hypothetical protein
VLPENPTWRVPSNASSPHRAYDAPGEPGVVLDSYGYLGSSAADLFAPRLCRAPSGGLRLSRRAPKQFRTEAEPRCGGI